MERTKNKWVTQRNNAITRLKELDSNYQPPSQYNYKNVKLEDKVYIPADEHPEINFVGLILGPRGNYLEKIKKDTNCNIIIRGKGSLKSGMTGITKTGTKVDGLDEPLHALVTVRKMNFRILFSNVFGGCGYYFRAMNLCMKMKLTLVEFIQTKLSGYL